MNYVKKPVVIEAFHFVPGEPFPDWFIRAHDEGKIALISDESDNRAYIETLEGTMLAIEGDYIIRGVMGELYPCKPDIFEKTYEPTDRIVEAEHDDPLANENT